MERNLLIIMHQSLRSYKENVRYPVNAGQDQLSAFQGRLKSEGKSWVSSSSAAAQSDKLRRAARTPRLRVRPATFLMSASCDLSIGF